MEEGFSHDYMEDNMQKDEAVEDILAQLEEIYASDGDEAEELESAISAELWVPSLARQERAYQRNMEYLKDYPFFLGNRYPISPKDNPCHLVQVSEEVALFFNSARKKFRKLETDSVYETRYFFQDIEKALFVEREYNRHNLRFLVDNVRASEDYAGDNHIYLWYENLEEFSLLLYYADLEELLREKKIVILIGESERELYPLNFKKRYGIDYASGKPKPVRIVEMKRLCHWFKHAHSGTGFSLGILGSNSIVQMVYGSPFNTWSKIQEKPMIFSDVFLRFMQDVETRYSFEKVWEVVHSEDIYLNVPDMDDFLHWLEKEQAQEGYTIADLLRGYALFHYSKRKLNPRVAPMLLFDPHMWDPRAYDALLLSFPYRTTLTCMRDPIMRFASCYKNGIGGWNRFQTMYLLGSDYAHGMFFNMQFKDNYWGFRFEDLKTKPKQTLAPVCRKLDIPFESQMLEQDAPSDNSCSGEVIHGFDQKALHYKFDDVLSEFDKLRLKIFYEPIHKYYGYDAFDSYEYPLAPHIVKVLFSFPFRFERHLYPNVTSEELHSWIQEVLQHQWKKSIFCPKLIPLDESEEDKSVKEQ